MNFVHNAALPSYLAYTAKKAGVARFIYASSYSVYGYTVNELYDEDAPVTCGYPYGISKLQGERGVLQLQDDTFSTIALRQGTVCGYSPGCASDLIVNTMYKIAVRRPDHRQQPLDLAADPRRSRHLDGLSCAAVQAEPSISGVFNVAGGNFTVGQIGDVVRDERRSGRPAGRSRSRSRICRISCNYKVTCDRAGDAGIRALVPRRRHYPESPRGTDLGEYGWLFLAGILQHRGIPPAVGRRISRAA